MSWLFIFRIFILSFISSLTNAQCVIFHGNDPIKLNNRDALTDLLKKESNCPQTIQAFSHLLKENNLTIKTSMVANRGKNNPDLGSFSFFSSISGILPDGFHINSGDFYLGHFTTLEDDVIQLDQHPHKNKLLIELIVWDNSGQFFNFYELRGMDSSDTRWFYRGNSKDAYLDNQYLHRNSPSKTEKFGKRMRCSACHNSGGPIIKEIKAPHNDWWTHENQLIFSPNHPDIEVNELVNTLIDARQFSDEVRAGIEKLNHSNPFIQFKGGLTLQEQLRPLFCTVEINLESNPTSGLSNEITIPSGFWLNPLLGSIQINIPAEVYFERLQANRMRFPETTYLDADHGWLTPVKGLSDIDAIKQLIKDKIITQQFARRVLMIDYSNPVVSKNRCDLLKLIPMSRGNHWVDVFIDSLHQAKENSPHALLLANYLTQEHKYNATYFQQILDKYKTSIQNRILKEEGQQETFRKLIQLRQDVLDNEISKNPLGQILEPGFRVIFPVPE